MRINTRELYGDKWFLRHDVETDRVYVKHVANPASGGRQTDYDVAAFMNGPPAPERAALLRLIAGLAEKNSDEET